MPEGLGSTCTARAARRCLRCPRRQRSPSTVLPHSVDVSMRTYSGSDQMSVTSDTAADVEPIWTRPLGEARRPMPVWDLRDMRLPHNAKKFKELTRSSPGS